MYTLGLCGSAMQEACAHMSMCVCSLQGVFYSIRSFCNEAEYCSEVDMVPGVEGKTFIVQVRTCMEYWYVNEHCGQQHYVS